MERPDFWQIESAHFDRGVQTICGVDEAGAGPLAGRVYAAAVILPRGWDAPYLNDSKKVTEKRREILYEKIIQAAESYAIAWADEKEIDEINILNARMLAMERAIQALDKTPDLALIDGNRSTGITCPNETVVKGDARSASIAAASILAKVARDRYMLEQAALYPQYAFERHKGYPTKLHYERLREHGPSPIHRLTFLKKL
ncbi:ribonuclease HII [Evtepia sp.]|uniref:ribonuclease HII n=1 Tax=Evtepia sp. TaxID=2773933 RepID=UPI003F167D9E